ncbi:MAG TPA: gas vesicle protein GvpG [Trebonia sp.]
MGLVAMVLGAPLLPVKGVVRLAELIQDEAERKLHDPATVRAEIEEAERLHADGVISDQELTDRQQDALNRLTTTWDPGRDTNSGGG